MKRVLVDQGSGTKIMYLDLYKGLNLKPEDLAAYDSPLVSFDGKVVILKGQIGLHIQASSKVVEVDFMWWMLNLPIRPLWQDPGFIPWGLFLPPCI